MSAPQQLPYDMSDHRKLKVWVEAHALTLGLYRRCGSFPETERFGLASQIRRSAASIGTNLVEGCGRGSDAELLRFVRIARGSARELEYQLLLGRDLNFLDHQEWTDYQERVDKISRMLSQLLRMKRRD